MPRFVPALGGAVVVLGVAFALTYFANQQGLGGSGPLDSRTPFLGVWISDPGDADGGTQTMTVERAAGNTVSVLVDRHDRLGV